MLAIPFHRDFPFAGIDVLVVHRVLDSTARSGDYLSNLILFPAQLQFDEALCEHGVDPIQSDVRLLQLMLDIQTVPDVPNCTIVLGNATEDAIDKL